MNKASSHQLCLDFWAQCDCCDEWLIIKDQQLEKRLKGNPKAKFRCEDAGVVCQGDNAQKGVLSNQQMHHMMNQVTQMNRQGQYPVGAQRPSQYGAQRPSVGNFGQIQKPPSQ